MLLTLGGCRTDRTADRESAGHHEAAPPPFTDITASCGLAFRHEAGVNGRYRMPEIMGAGAAWLDYDGDGLLDAYLVNGARADAGDGTPPPTNRLFRQNEDGRFVDVTSGSGLGDPGFGMGVAVGDMDNDGDPDVFITNYGPDRLYRNNGDGTFTDVTQEARITGDTWSTSAGFIDCDADGHLDLFVVHYLAYDPDVPCADQAGRPDYCGPQEFPGVPDVLYRNNGDGTFTDISAPAGIARRAGKGLGLVCTDINNDGRVDVYVANDGEANFLWVNVGVRSDAGDGHHVRFEDRAVELGVAFNHAGGSEASMGVTAGDINADGRMDLFMTHLRTETNTLYLSDALGFFRDATIDSGVGAPSIPYTGFGTGLFDYDHDGDLDLAIVNGKVARGGSSRGTSGAAFFEDYGEPNLVLEHASAGRFTDVSSSASPLCAGRDVSRGLAFGDLDNDGDLDLLVSNCNGPPRVYRNDAMKRGHWLMVRAVDNALHRDAIGARITVVAGGRRYMREVNPTYSYASTSDHRAHFGLGDADHVEEIVVHWPGGATEVFRDRAVDRTVVLVKNAGDGGSI